MKVHSLPRGKWNASQVNSKKCVAFEKHSFHPFYSLEATRLRHTLTTFTHSLAYHATHVSYGVQHLHRTNGVGVCLLFINTNNVLRRKRIIFNVILSLIYFVTFFSSFFGTDCLFFSDVESYFVCRNRCYQTNGRV